MKKKREEPATTNMGISSICTFFGDVMLFTCLFGGAESRSPAEVDRGHHSGLRQETVEDGGARQVLLQFPKHKNDGIKFS